MACSSVWTTFVLVYKTWDFFAIANEIFETTFFLFNFVEDLSKVEIQELLILVGHVSIEIIFMLRFANFSSW